jgi:hypothetical protein
MADTRKLATASLFAVIIALVVGPALPPPTGDLLIGVEALLLGLGFILLGFGGATFTATIAGALLNIVEPGFWLFPLLLAVLYGIQIDAFSTFFRVRSNGFISTRKLAASLMLSSATTGPIAYYTTVAAGVVPSSPVLFYLFIIGFGVFSGAIAAYFTVRLWDRGLKAWFAPKLEG